MQVFVPTHNIENLRHLFAKWFLRFPERELFLYQVDEGYIVKDGKAEWSIYHEALSVLIK